MTTTHFLRFKKKIKNQSSIKRKNWEKTIRDRQQHQHKRDNFAWFLITLLTIIQLILNSHYQKFTTLRTEKLYEQYSFLVNVSFFFFFPEVDTLQKSEFSLIKCYSKTQYKVKYSVCQHTSLQFPEQTKMYSCTLP